VTRSSYKLNNPEETNEDESLVSDQNSEEAEWQLKEIKKEKKKHHES
jgi:hypothetical protein